jgi:hypothetical protein
LLTVVLHYAEISLHEHVATCCLTPQGSVPVWLSILSSPIGALVALLPGFIAGWAAQRRGILVGFLTGLLGSALYSAVFGTFWRSTIEQGLPEILTLASWLLLMSVASGLYGAAAGASAQLLRSNNALEQTWEG